MATVRELMNDWGRGFLAEKYGDAYISSGTDIVFEEESETWQGCETCGNYGTDYTVLVIDTGNNDDRWYERTYTGSMLDLINAMSQKGY